LHLAPAPLPLAAAAAEELWFARLVVQRLVAVSPGLVARFGAGVTPGYGDEVIFADGTFIDGSTAELSADGPIRPPYVVYCQVGTPPVLPFACC
jgi:hypothetical protein